MNAKSKADFINSVASGEQTTCPSCGTANKNNAKFCVKCGAKLIIQETPAPSAPAESTPFAPAQPTPAEQTPFAPAPTAPQKSAEPKKTTAMPFANTAPIEEEEEEKSAFALGLPSWNIDPPQVMVRRKKSK